MASTVRLTSAAPLFSAAFGSKPLMQKLHENYSVARVPHISDMCSRALHERTTGLNRHTSVPTATFTSFREGPFRASRPTAQEQPFGSSVIQISKSARIEAVRMKRISKSSREGVELSPESQPIT